MTNKTGRDLIIVTVVATLGIIGLLIFGFLDYTTRVM